MAQTPKRRHRESARKGRLTLSLEKTTIQFLQERQSEAKAPSLSACVEGVVDAYRRQLEAQELHQQTVAYYDAISDAETGEDQAWGQLAEREFLATS